MGLHDRIRKNVQAILRSRGFHRGDDAGDDLVQEVQAEVATRYAHLSEDARVLVAGGIAKRKLADLYRARAMWLKHAPKVERRAEAYDSLGIGNRPDAEAVSRLTAAIKALKEEDRVHINLWARGVPPEELAKLVGKTPGAERTARARLFERLKQMMEEFRSGAPGGNARVGGSDGVQA